MRGVVRVRVGPARAGGESNRYEPRSCTVSSGEEQRTAQSMATRAPKKGVGGDIATKLEEESKGGGLALGMRGAWEGTRIDLGRCD